MDPSLDLETRRLYLSAALTVQVRRLIGGRIAADSGAQDLLALARVLEAEHIERAHHLSFDPSYPGVTAGAELVRGGLRFMLACRASDREGRPFGVVFTSLIPDRPPQVSVAPADTPISEDWRSLESTV